MKFNFFILVSSTLLLFFNLSHANDTDNCPKPKVTKQRIIRSKESIANGASLLFMKVVPRAHQCYSLCCNDAQCNTAVIHYKRVYDDNGDLAVQKQCYLFNCHSPSVCLFDEHTKYAIIELPDKYLPFTAAPTTQPPPQTTTEDLDQVEHELMTTTMSPPLTDHQEEEAAVTAAAALSEAAETAAVTAVATAAPADEPAEKENTAAPPEAVKPATELPATAEPAKKANEQSVMVQEEDTSPVQEESIPGEESPAKEKGGEEEDEYYQSERRDWLEVSSKAPSPTQQPDTEMPSRSEMPVPKTKRAPATENAGTMDGATEAPVIINLTPKMSSVTAVPLLIALIICVCLLLIIMYRLKCSKRGKPKKFEVDDGDYLINGMYL